MLEIRREEKVYFCYSEAREKMFSNVPEQVLSAWFLVLNVDRHECTKEESELLKISLIAEPYQLIEKNDLAKIQQMYMFCYGKQLSLNHLTAPLNRKDNSVVSCEHSFDAKYPPRPSIIVETATGLIPNESENQNSGAKLDHVQQSLELIECTNEGVSKNEISCELQLNQDKPRVSQAVSNPEQSFQTQEQNFQDVSEQDNSCPKEQTCAKRQACTLNQNEMSAELTSKIEQIKRFYSAEVNFQRQGLCLQPSTISKMLERLSSFLWFLKYVKGMQPDLSACENAEMVQEFVRYMTGHRKTKASTCSRYITALINVVKVLNSEKGLRSDDAINLEQLRSIQRQLEKLGRQERMFEDASKPAVEKKIIFSEILELCRELKWSFEEGRGIDQARQCMNLSLLLLYCSANPGRIKEY
ncbi:uncharacterized protein LOC144639850, partial [Oculina patagonica]